MEKAVMEKISFTCKGHENILATHRNSFEFTKDSDVSRQGDCIIGVACDFDAKKLIDFAKKHDEFLIRLECNSVVETVAGKTNPSFSDEHEVVVRIGDFASGRTFGIRADKVARMLSGGFIGALKKNESVLKVEITPAEQKI